MRKNEIYKLNFIRFQQVTIKGQITYIPFWSSEIKSPSPEKSIIKIRICSLSSGKTKRREGIASCCDSNYKRYMELVHLLPPIRFYMALFWNINRFGFTFIWPSAKTCFIKIDEQNGMRRILHHFFNGMYVTVNIING